MRMKEQSFPVRGTEWELMRVKIVWRKNPQNNQTTKVNLQGCSFCAVSYLSYYPFKSWAFTPQWGNLTVWEQSDACWPTRLQVVNKSVHCYWSVMPPPMPPFLLLLLTVTVTVSDEIGGGWMDGGGGLLQWPAVSLPGGHSPPRLPVRQHGPVDATRHLVPPAPLRDQWTVLVFKEVTCLDIVQ